MRRISSLLALGLAALGVVCNSAAQTRASGPGQPRVWAQTAPGALGASSLGMFPAAAAHADRIGPQDASALRLRRADETLAQRFGLRMRGSMLDAVLEPRAGADATLAARVRDLGGSIRWQRAGALSVRLPAAQLSRLAATPALAGLRSPQPAVPLAVVGEGVSATNAAEWQPHGLTGKGVKVAVIDVGFGGLADRQAAGEIPPLAGKADFCDGHFDGPEVHGTAVAEIVSAQAPGAKLYLACVDTDEQLVQAEQWVKANGVRIVNFSVGFFGTWRGDGKGPAGTPDAVVADARANGILWVNAAGNEAMSHWAGSFVSADGDPFNEFTPGDEVNSLAVPPGESVCGVLRWDEWPVSSDDFDLGFYDTEAQQFVAVSARDQAHLPLTPVEGLCVENGDSVTHYGGFAIARYAGSGTPQFDLNEFGGPYSLALELSTAARSIVDPAASASALAAGADCWQTGVLEPYSSQGPTIDGRTKPDLVAPDSVSTATYGGFSGCGVSGFAGTSAAAPQTVGAAALLEQRFRALTAAGLQQFLVGKAVDEGAPGADNQYGAGKLWLPSLPQAKVKALAARGSYGKQVKLRFELTGVQWDLREHVHVYRRTNLAWTRQLPFTLERSGRILAVRWKAPRAARAPFRFCVEAWDRAGHASRRSCATVTLHR